MRFFLTAPGIASVSLVALLTAACGGGDSSNEGTTGTTTGDGGGGTTTSSSSGNTGGGGGAGGADAVCGDGNVDAGEACDDGAGNGDDKACKSDCTAQACGDGFVGPGEACDDGADNGDDKACKSDCTAQACGDGSVGPGEECDDGADNGDTNACKSDCTAQACGDGFVGPGEECDDGAGNGNDKACKSDCTSQACGDGFVGPGEGCDDGNMVDNDACSNACTLASCGDGIAQPGEACDDGNMVNTDGCTNACTLPACGDGFQQAGEECDLGAANSNTGACKANCTTQKCGDGFVGPGEACDDGNLLNTDACLVTCVAAACGDGNVQAGVEACDDGNQVNGDGCNTNCVASGSPVWTQTFNSATNLDDYASAVAVDPSGNIVVAGTTTVPGQATNAWVRKYNPDGSVQWTDTYNAPANLDDEAFGIATDVGGNVFVVGYESYAAADQDVWVRRYAPNGTMVWTQSFTSPNAAMDIGYGIAVDPQGNPLITGNLTLVNNGSDVFVAKLAAATGTITWSQTFNTGPNLNDLGYGIACDANGDAVVVGGAANGSFFDVWVRKYGGAAGATLWTQTYGSAPNNDFGFGVAMDSANNPIVGGTEYGPGQDFNDWVRKYTTNGATTWTQTYNGAANGSDSVFAVDTDASNNVVAAGRETVAGQGTNVWVRKYSAAGATMWTQTYGGASNLDDFAAGVAVDANGNAVVVGSETVAGQGANVWIRKYAP